MTNRENEAPKGQWDAAASSWADGGHDEVPIAAGRTPGPRRVLGGAGPAWLTYGLVALALAGLGGVLWYFLAPESMARLYGRWQNRPLAIKSLAVTIDRQTVELPPNGTVEIHPGQRLAVAGLDTNRWLN